MTYSTSEASDMAGVSYTRLNRWAASGTLVPTTPARGSGYPARYSLSDTLKARALGRLIAGSGGTYASPVGVAVIITASDANLLDHITFKDEWVTTELDLSLEGDKEPQLMYALANAPLDRSAVPEYRRIDGDYALID